MAQPDREAVIKTFVNKSAEQSKKSRSAIQAMQEALDVSERKCKKLSEASRSSEARLQSVLADQQRLEEENRQLQKKLIDS